MITNIREMITKILLITFLFHVKCADVKVGSHSHNIFSHAIGKPFLKQEMALKPVKW